MYTPFSMMMSLPLWVVLYFFEFQSPLCSALTIAAINIERCYVVKYPLRVRSVITFRRKLVVIAGIWMISILCSIHVIHQIRFLMVVDYMDINNIDLWIPIAQFVIPAVTIIITCVVTTVTLYIRLKGINGSANLSTSTDNSLRYTKKAIKTVLIVAVVFLCMTAPHEIIRFINIYNYHKFRYVHWVHVQFVVSITSVLKIANCCVNPFIYVLMSSTFRSAVKSTICRKASMGRQGHLNYGHV